MSYSITQKLIAEFIGTFALVFIGAGAGALGVGGLVGVALAHGLVVTSFAYAYGPISGCHLNPAVTVGLTVAGRMQVADAIAYIVTQLVAAAVAAGVLAFVLGGTTTGLGATTLAQSLTVGGVTISVGVVQGVVIEAIATFLLVNVILHTAVSGKAGDLAPLAIGLTLTLAILMAGPLTGASLNPARSFGPALILGEFGQLWVYVVGPVAGAAAAALLWKNVLPR